MVNFTILQVVLLTLLAFIKHVDYYGIPMIFVNYAVFWGLITGVVMGDWKTGLVIGGTIQLMQLGVAGFGGSSIPDYGTMAIIATAYGVTLGSDTGLAIGLPVGMLGIQLTQRAYASAENVQSYKALIARGVKVTAQFVPADKPVSVADLI